jgi:hypothetical protein
MPSRLFASALTLSYTTCARSPGSAQDAPVAGKVVPLPPTVSDPSEMNHTRTRALHLLLMCASPSLPAASQAPGPMGVVQVGGAQRDDIRRTVERHRDAQREEVRRGELAAGRRLTAAELLELRAQVRQQSQALADADADAQQGGARVVPETRPAAPMLPTAARSLTMPRSQRQP